MTVVEHDHRLDAAFAESESNLRAGRAVSRRRCSGRARSTAASAWIRPRRARRPRRCCGASARRAASARQHHRRSLHLVLGRTQIAFGVYARDRITGTRGSQARRRGRGLDGIRKDSGSTSRGRLTLVDAEGRSATRRPTRCARRCRRLRRASCSCCSSRRRPAVPNASARSRSTPLAWWLTPAERKPSGCYTRRPRIDGGMTVSVIIAAVWAGHAPRRRRRQAVAVDRRPLPAERSIAAFDAHRASARSSSCVPPGSGDPPRCRRETKAHRVVTAGRGGRIRWPRGLPRSRQRPRSYLVHDAARPFVSAPSSIAPSMALWRPAPSCPPCRYTTP